jgi:hypothetical protein
VFGHTIEPSCEPDNGDRQLEPFCLVLRLEIEFIKDWIVEILDDELLRVKLINIGVGVLESESLCDVF